MNSELLNNLLFNKAVKDLVEKMYKPINPDILKFLSEHPEVSTNIIDGEKYDWKLQGKSK